MKVAKITSGTKSELSTFAILVTMPTFMCVYATINPQAIKKAVSITMLTADSLYLDMN